MKHRVAAANAAPGRAQTAMASMVVLFACLLAPNFPSASAQTAEEVFVGEGLRVEFPGWRQVTPAAGNLEQLMEIRPVQMEPTFRVCSIERADLPALHGMTQTLLNQRMRDSIDDYEDSPTYLEIGEIEEVSVSETDGIAILDIVVRGTNPTGYAWMHDRVFAVVNDAAGTGRYHRFSCIAMAHPTPRLAAEIDDIMASLRFIR